MSTGRAPAREDAMSGDTVLLAIDLKAPSAAALALARGEARRRGARLLTLHVIRRGERCVGVGRSVVRLQPAPSVARLQQRLAAVTGPPPADLDEEHDLAAGDPAEEVLRVARERGAGLIVLGCAGRVAERVRRDAPCPVLTAEEAAAGTP
jgi:nucleotide-binding universal stress UspA family protein